VTGQVPNSPVHPDAIKHQVRFKLAGLRKLTYAELSKLPEVSTAAVRFGQSSATLTTFREGVAGERLAIVVRCGPKGATDGFIWHGLHADGFYIEPNGQTTAIPERILFAYM
jgi:hypothetical protein